MAWHMDLDADIRVQDWLWMSSIYYPIGIILLYLMFTFYWGPLIMQNRDNEPIENVGHINRLFNYANATINFCLGTTLVYFICRANYGFPCQPIRQNGDFELQIARCVWLFHVLKVVELLESAFVLFRDRPDRINAFHIYHHVSILILTWFGVKLVPGGSTVYPVIINCYVHVISYAAFHLLRYFDEENYINQFMRTHIIILGTQFTTIGLLNLWTILGPDCGYSRWASGIVLAYMMSFGLAYVGVLIIRWIRTWF